MLSYRKKKKKLFTVSYTFTLKKKIRAYIFSKLLRIPLTWWFFYVHLHSYNFFSRCFFFLHFPFIKKLSNLYFL